LLAGTAHLYIGMEAITVANGGVDVMAKGSAVKVIMQPSM
jgi:hypothetical protein